MYCSCRLKYRARESTPPEAKLSDEIQTKVLRVFLLIIHNHLYSFALRFLFLKTHATSSSFCKEKEEKPDGKPHPLPYGLRNPFRNLKSENSQDYALEASMKLYVHEFGFRLTMYT
jgi:hypothetical protein